MVLQAHVAVSVYSKVVSGFSSDTIVINNAKKEMEKKDFPQVSRKSYAMMLHRSLESINFKWGRQTLNILNPKSRLKLDSSEELDLTNR